MIVKCDLGTTDHIYFILILGSGSCPPALFCPPEASLAYSLNPAVFLDGLLHMLFLLSRRFFPPFP